MADHSKPLTTSTYTNFVTELDGRFDDLTVGLDPAVTTATNLATNAIRWTSASSKWQKYNGTSWADLSSAYSININGTVGETTPNTGAFTTLSATGNVTLGDASGDTVTINGTVAAGVVVSGSTATDAFRITQTGAGNAFVVEDSTNPDSTPFVVDASGNVGIGTSSPGTFKLAVVGGRIQLSGGTTSQEGIAIQRVSGAATISGINNDNNAFNALAFYTSATEAMRIDTGGNVGIGTSSPQSLLDITGNDPTIRLTDNAGSPTATWSMRSADGNYYIRSVTASADRITIDSSGNVGIGTSSPSKKLDVFNSGTTTTDFVVRNGTVSLLSFVDSGAGYTGTTTSHPLLFTTAGTERMRIDSSGNLNMTGGGQIIAGNGTVLSPSITFSGSTATGLYRPAGGTIGFVYGGTEAMRIDSSGFVQVNSNNLMPYQGAQTSKSAAATLSGAELITGILQYTGAAATVNIPTGANIEAALTWSANNVSLDWRVINTGSGTCTIGANSNTTVGTLTVAANTSAHFRIRRTAANTFTIYRMS